MKRYHRLLIAATAFFVCIPATPINLSDYAGSAWSYLGLCFAFCLAFATVGFKALLRAFSGA